MRQRSNRSSGFTVLEILVTLVVVGLIYATVALGLRLVMQVRAKQAALRADSWALTDGWQAARQALAAMDPGSRTRPAMFAASADRLAFTTVLPEPRRLVDAALLVDEGHRLVLRWVPRAAGGSGGERVLAQGVAALAFGYRGSGWAGQWQDGWNGPRLPGMVRLSVAWTDHTRHPWPPIIAGPTLTLPRD